MEEVITENKLKSNAADSGISNRDSLVEMFVRLNMARKVGEYCSCDHPRCLQASERAAEISERLVKNGELGFASHDGSIAAGGSRFDPEEPFLEDFAAALRKAGITVLRLTEGVSDESLADFTRLLTASTALGAESGQIRQELSGLVAEGIRVGLSPPAAQPAENGPLLDEATWKSEVRRLLGAEPDERGYQENDGYGEQLILADIDPRRMAELINDLDSVGSVDTISQRFLVPYLHQAATNRDGSEGLVPDRTRGQFLQLLRSLSPGHQIHFITAVLEMSHTFTDFAKAVLMAIPVHMADQAFAMIRTQENTIHPQITSNFEALCYLTGHTATAVHSIPVAPTAPDADTDTAERLVPHTPLVDIGPEPMIAEPSAVESARPLRRLSFAADFNRAGKRRATIRVVLDLLERTTAPEEARSISSSLPPLFTEALEARDWIGLSRDWSDLTGLVEKSRIAKPFLEKSLQSIRKSFVTTQAMVFIISSIESSTEESARVIREWLPLLGLAASESLIQALIASRSRTKRRNLLSAIVCFGNEAVPLALKRTGDVRWYVVRNMISIIREIGDTGAADELLQLADHAQIQVRRELMNTLFALRHPQSLELAKRYIRAAEPKMRSACIGLLGTHPMDGARDLLLRILSEENYGITPFSEPQKERAVWALGKIGDSTVLPLLQKFLKKKGVFGSSERHDLSMAILRSLPDYPLEAVDPLAKWGVNHGNADEAAICSRLLSNLLLTRERAPE